MPGMRVIVTFLLLCCLVVIPLTAQEKVRFRKDTVLAGSVLGKDTMPHIELDEIAIIPKPVFKNRFDERRYWKLVYNLKKVLPYSKLVAQTVVVVDRKMAQLPDDRARRKYLRNVEDTLWNKYEKDLRNMTITQGQLLFKLVARETAESTYFWIDHYRGSVSAFFWQGMARLFGSNLKSDYDPQGADALIEQLIGYIEKGWI
jgi:hypothetical protein